jgi:hypothetical protein
VWTCGPAWDRPQGHTAHGTAPRYILSVLVTVTELGVTGMAGGAAPQAVGTGYWCKWCGEPVRLKGRNVFPELRRAVHAATGREVGPGFGEDGSHAAMPTDQNPVLRAEANAIQALFPEVKVSVRFGIFRAWKRPELLPPGVTAVPYAARTGDELLERLRVVLR